MERKEKEHMRKLTISYAFFNIYFPVKVVLARYKVISRRKSLFAKTYERFPTVKLFFR